MTTSPNLQVQIVADTTGTISVNGHNYHFTNDGRFTIDNLPQQYKYTVLKLDGASQQDITGARDWRHIAAQVAQFCCNEINQHSLENANFKVSLDRADFDTIHLRSPTHNVNFAEAQINFNHNNTLKTTTINPQNPSQINPQQIGRIYTTLQNIGASFATARPVANWQPTLPTPITTQQTPPNPPLVPYVSPTTALRVVDVGGGGRCLDKSLAYKLLVRNGNANPSAAEITTLADHLRTYVSTQLNNAAQYDRNQDFQNLLISAVRDIQTSAPQLIPANIAAILSSTNPTSDAEKTQLRTFYAAYITNNYTTGTGNDLDGAFIYVLSRAPVNFQGLNPTHFPQGFEFAVIKPAAGPQHALQKFSTHDLLTDNFLFVELNSGHYVAVTQARENIAIIRTRVQNEHTQILNQFLTILDTNTTTGDQFYTALGTLLAQLPPAALAALHTEILTHDTNQWLRADPNNRLPDPRNLPLPTYLGAPFNSYGEYRFTAAGADQQSKNDLRDAFRAITSGQIRTVLQPHL